MATPSTGVGRGVGGGAPEKYKEEYCEEIIHYFRNYSGFPTLEGFATDVLDVDPKFILFQPLVLELVHAYCFFSAEPTPSPL